NFQRATLRFPEFCEGWNALVQLGLTDENKEWDTQNLSFFNWTTQKINTKKEEYFSSIAKFLKIPENSRVMRQIKFLGILKPDMINLGKKSNAAILQSVLEDKLKMNATDKDLVVMQHDIQFERRNIQTKMTSHLIVQGTDSVHTAMAKTVGLPLGIITRLILTDHLPLTGLHLPVLPEIYEPVLKEMEDYELCFEENFQ
ncbi:MAG: saccharopine dehydrogenase C-terminal domain-containing protein, partial [Chitinophagaceae bacterium]